MSSSSPDPVAVTRLAYEVDADVWAQARQDRSAIEPFIARFAGLAGNGAHVLDVGCGPGFDTAALAAAGMRPVALDLAEAMVKLTAARVAGPAVQGDARYLPFVSSTFEAVWASASLIHISRADVGLALQDLRRVLKPNGVLYSRMQVGDGEGVEEPRPDNPITMPRFFARYTADAWQVILEANGYEVIEQQEEPNPSGRRWLSAFARST